MHSTFIKREKRNRLECREVENAQPIIMQFAGQTGNHWMMILSCMVNTLKFIVEILLTAAVCCLGHGVL